MSKQASPKNTGKLVIKRGKLDKEQASIGNNSFIYPSKCLAVTVP